MTAADFADCNDCGRATDENDAAPSCGAHRVCVPCYSLGHFACRECDRVTDEIRRDDADDRAHILARDARADR